MFICRVAQTLVFCEMICRSWFIVLSFGHCIVHLPLDLRFLLHLWYLLTFPIQGENRNIPVVLLLATKPVTSHSFITYVYDILPKQ
jgi:hypothetical protein